MKISGPVSSSNPHVAYVTRLGGSATDYLGGLAVDPDGNVFLAGYTNSRDFPTTPGTFQPASATGGGFLLKLDPSGKKLVYSTYLDQSGTSSFNGGTAINAIAIDGNGNAYVGGTTSSRTFPTTGGAYEGSVSPAPTAVGEYTVGFVSKFDASGKTLLASTLIGGPALLGGYISVTSVAVDATGIIHISGSLGAQYTAVHFAQIKAVPITSDAPYTNGPGFLAIPHCFRTGPLKLDGSSRSFRLRSSSIRR